MAENWLHDLFINEAKPALERYSGGNNSGGVIPMASEFMPDVILTSPNGTKYRLIVADDGTVSTVTV